MDANLNKIAQDLYGKIQTRFKNINIGDENAEVLSKKEDIPRARFFEFEYEEDGEALGTIAITLDAEDGVVMQVSGDLVDDEDKTTRHKAFQFIRGFRQFAKDRLLNFDVQNIGKSNLDKRDYEFQAKRKEMPIMPAIMENKLYGNNKVSYQDLGETRLIIKHSRPINVDLPAGRTMHIESIYIENAEGERFKYPYRHINGARALAEHIGHGGNPYDNIGQYICGLSEELNGLRKFKGYVSRQEQLSEAMASVTNRVAERIEEIKDTISKLQKTSYYETFVESFEDPEEVFVPEDLQNDLIDRLTIRTFNEELKSVFPYIYKFIDESELPVVEIAAEDLLGEDEEKCDSCGEVIKDCECPGHDHKTDESLQPEDQFESFIEDLVNEDKNEILSPNEGAKASAIEKLNGILSQNLQVGPNGDNAVMTLKGLIDDPSFIEAVKSVPAETDLNDIVRGWIETKHEDLLDQLQFPSDENAVAEPTPAPTDAEIQAAAPAPAPAPTPAPTDAEIQAAEPAPGQAPAPAPAPAPMAEEKQKGVDGKACWKGYKRMGTKQKGGKTVDNCVPMEGIGNLIQQAINSGATLETMVGNRTLGSLIEMCGMKPQDFGMKMPQQDGLEGMLKFISGFYNRENGNFPLGGMRIKIKVKKEFDDGVFGGASEDDLIKVLKFIDAKDPSGVEQNNIIRLAGVKKNSHEGPGFDVSALEDQMNQVALQFNEAAPQQQFPALKIGDIDPRNGKKILSAMVDGSGNVVRSTYGDIYNVKYGPAPAPVATAPTATAPVATAPVATAPVATAPTATAPVATTPAPEVSIAQSGGGRQPALQPTPAPAPEPAAAPAPAPEPAAAPVATSSTAVDATAQAAASAASNTGKTDSSGTSGPAPAEIVQPASTGNVPPRPTLNGKPSNGPRGRAWLAQYGATHNNDGTPKTGSNTGNQSVKAQPAKAGPQPAKDGNTVRAQPSAVPQSYDLKTVNDFIRKQMPNATPGDQYWVQGQVYQLDNIYANGKAMTVWKPTFKVPFGWNRERVEQKYTGPNSGFSSQSAVKETVGYDEVDRLVSLVHYR